MPEIDYDPAKWQHFVRTWNQHAAASKATSKTLFGQWMYLASAVNPTVGGAAKMPEGVCFGVAALYLARKRQGTAATFLSEVFSVSGAMVAAKDTARGALTKEKIASRGLYSADAKYNYLRKKRDRQLDDTAKQMRSDIGTYHNSQHDETGGAKGKQVLEAAGLTHDEKMSFDSYFSRNKRLAAYLAEHTPSYCLIQTPNHALASVRVGASYAFFDPNFGEVTFNDAANFTKFVTSFFGEDNVRTWYRGEKTREGKKVPHQTIRFVVDRYH